MRSSPYARAPATLAKGGPAPAAQGAAGFSKIRKYSRSMKSWRSR
ncbi:MAG: hypothetical protein ACK559_17450 [bacterium]